MIIITSTFDCMDTNFVPRSRVTKTQFYPPKRPLRDAFLAQNTLLSAKKDPAGRFSRQNTIVSARKAPTGSFPAQNTFFFAQKAPAGRIPDLRNINKNMLPDIFSALIYAI